MPPPPGHASTWALGPAAGVHVPVCSGSLYALKKRERRRDGDGRVSAVIPSKGSGDIANHQTQPEWFVARAPVELTQKALLQIFPK